MKPETLIGLGVIGFLIFQSMKRSPQTIGSPGVLPPPAAPGTRWEDVALQGVRTAGEVTQSIIARTATENPACARYAQGRMAGYPNLWSDDPDRQAEWRRLYQTQFDACKANPSLGAAPAS